MFFRVYSGILAATLIAGLCSFLLFNFVNQLRLVKHTEDIFSGTLILINEGVERHQGDARQRWLSLVRKLAGLSFTLKSFEEVQKEEDGLSDSELEQLLELKPVVKIQDSDRGAKIYGLASKDEKLVVVTEAQNVTEQLLRASALLILNELGRQKSSDDKKIDPKLASFYRMQTIFSQPISLTEKVDPNLDPYQTYRLNRGDLILALAPGLTPYEPDSFYVHAKLRNSNYLKLGPIPQFTSTPTWLLISLLLFSLGTVGIMTYWLVKNLERRINHVGDVVTKYGPGFLGMRAQVEGTDSVANLASSINAMTSRIEGLLEDQKEITQAISHELRTPIARMKFRIEMLNERAKENGFSKTEMQHYSKLKNDVKELNGLVDELLLYHMLDQEGKERPLTKVSIKPMVDELISENYEQYPNVELIIMASEGDIYLESDQHDVRHLIQNLLINAYKHAKSQIQIELNQLDSGFEFRIEDDGTGIPEEKMERIFTPFVRLDTSRNKKTGGFGLGLAIVHKIVKRHHGDIQVGKSRWDGAMFYFKLPDIKRQTHEKRDQVEEIGPTLGSEEENPSLTDLERYRSIQKDRIPGNSSVNPSGNSPGNLENDKESHKESQQSAKGSQSTVSKNKDSQNIAQFPPKTPPEDSGVRS